MFSHQHFSTLVWTGRTTIQSRCGATLGIVIVTDLDFAHDVTILPKSMESLVAALDAFNL